MAGMEMTGMRIIFFKKEKACVIAVVAMTLS